MRSTFARRIGNWKGLEPCIVKWLTWEAQRGKTQLDTHFAHLNKHLAKVCFEGDIDFLDPQKVFEALAHGDGSRATTTLLLSELEEAQILFHNCDGAIASKERSGIKSTHDITFDSDEEVIQ